MALGLYFCVGGLTLCSGCYCLHGLLFWILGWWLLCLCCCMVTVLWVCLALFDGLAFVVWLIVLCSFFVYYSL